MSLFWYEIPYAKSYQDISGTTNINVSEKNKKQNKLHNGHLKENGNVCFLNFRSLTVTFLQV